MMMNEQENTTARTVPIWLKPNLSIKEAAAYSGIGEVSLRELVASGEANISFCVGRKILINRDLLDEYVKKLCKRTDCR